MAQMTSNKPFEEKSEDGPLIHHLVFPLNYFEPNGNPTTNRDAELGVEAWLRRGYVLANIHFAAEVASQADARQVAYSRIVYTVVKREYVA